MQNLRKGQVLFVHDFSQNLLLVMQDEVSSDITSHREHHERCVAAFQKKTIDFLKSKKVPIVEILEWTDNAPAQYKSRNSFQRMLLMAKPITRNYFGEKHGKGPFDRAGACFKFTFQK